MELKVNCSLHPLKFNDSKRMSQPIKLSIPSHPKYLGLIRKVLQELLDYHEVSVLEIYKTLSDLKIEKLKKLEGQSSFSQTH